MVASRGTDAGAAFAAPSFNPLHCGAVVASERMNLTDVTDVLRFNPLHCGAVVASVVNIGGQNTTSKSFNPLHCGAVVASSRETFYEISERLLFQSPSLRGSGRFLGMLE